MFLKPDFNLKSIYDIDLNLLKSLGIKALLFGLDSTFMGSNTAYYTQETLPWLDKVKADFFVGVVSNNHNPMYMEKVRAVSDFPVVFEARKPDCKVASMFMKEYKLNPEETAFIGDRPLTDVLCGKRLGCKTILVDSITADIEKPIVRLARALERCCIRK